MYYRDDLKKWFEKFFSARNITGADGRQLYEYRMTKEESQNLEKCLLVEFQSNKFHQSTLFWAGFVLYSAAYLAYKYREGFWTWDPIFNDLFKGKKCVIDSNEKADGIIRAAKFWGHSEKIQLKGKKYLGYVMSQVGVPIEALKEKNSWLSSILVSSVRYVQRAHVGREMLAVYLNAHEEKIPSSFDKSDAKLLISSATLAINDALLGTNNFTSERFPSFPIDEADFLEIISSYKREIRVNNGKRVFEINRYLRLDTVPTFCIDISLANSITQINDLAKELGFERSEIECAKGLFCRNEPFAQIKLTESDKVRLIPLASSKKIKLRNELTLKGITTTLLLNNKQKHTKPFTRVDPFNLNEPIVFVEDSKIPHRYNYAASGSCSLPTKNAVIWLPKLWKHCVNGEFLGELFDGAIYKISNSIEFEIDKDRFEILLNQGTLPNEEFWVDGNFFGSTQDNILIYRGVPKIYRSELNEEGQIVRSGRCNITWFDWRHKQCNPNDLGSGIYVGKYLESGRTRKRFRFVVIPQSASVNVEFGNQRKAGVIKFINWRIHKCECNHCSDISIENNEHVLTFPSVKYYELKPIEVKLFGEGNPYPITLSEPYPQSYAHFVLGSEVLSQESTVPFADLFDLRVDIHDQDNKNSSYSIELTPEFGHGDKNLTYVISVPFNHKTGTSTVYLHTYKAALFRLVKLCRVFNKENISITLFKNSKLKSRCLVSSFLNQINVWEKGEYYSIQISNQFCEAPQENLISSMKTALVDANLMPDNEVPLHLKTYQLKAIPLFGNTTGELNLGIHGENRSFLIPKSCLATNSSWMIISKGEKRFDTKPVFIGVEGFDFSLISELRNNSEEIKNKLFASFTSNVLWNCLFLEFQKHGPRIFAQFPFWRALDRSVALAICLILDLKSHFSNPRSLTLSVARANGCRWDLLPIRELEKCLELLKGYFHHNHELSAFDRLSDLFDADFCTEFTSLASRFAYALLKVNFGPMSESVLHLKGTPLAALIRSDYSYDSLRAAQNSPLCLEARPADFHSMLSNDFYESTINQLEVLFKKQSCGYVLRLLSENINQQKLWGSLKVYQQNILSCILLSSVAVELFGDKIESAKTKELGLLRYKIETVFGEYPQWSAWCLNFSVFFVDVMKKNRKLVLES